LKSPLAPKPLASDADSVDPRVQRTRKVVLEATVALWQERGYAGCTVEAILQRTGVAKTTIYRHWPGRTELLAEALSIHAEQLVVVDTGSLRGDLVEFLTTSSHQMAESSLDRSLQTIPGLIEAAKRDPALVVVSAQLTSGLIGLIRRMLQKAKARREIRRDRDLDVVANTIVGAIFVQRAFLDKALTDDYVIKMIDTILEGIILVP
jgi:AcrR family transcriptional regulator